MTALRCPWCLKTEHAPCAASLVLVNKFFTGRALTALYTVGLGGVSLLDARARLLFLATKGDAHNKPTGGDVSRFLRKLRNCGHVAATDICYGLRLVVPAPPVGHCRTCTCFRPKEEKQ